MYLLDLMSTLKLPSVLLDYRCQGVERIKIIKAGVIQECRRRNKPRIQSDPEYLEVDVHARTEHL